MTEIIQKANAHFHKGKNEIIKEAENESSFLISKDMVSGLNTKIMSPLETLSILESNNVMKNIIHKDVQSDFESFK